MVSNSAVTTVIRGVLGTNAVAHTKEVSVRKIKPIPTENRRYSVLRASGHTFEYVGFGPGNYSTSMPQVQDRVRSEEEELIAQSLQTRGGFVVYTGMNDAGDFYIGNIKIEAGSNSLKFLNGGRVGTDEVGTSLPADATFDSLIVDSSFQSNGDTEVIDLLLKGNRSGDIGQSVYVGIHAGNITPTGNVDNILFRTSTDAGGYVGWIKTGTNWKRFGPISKSGETQSYAFDTLEVAGVSTFSSAINVTGTTTITGDLTASATVTAEQITSTDDINAVDDITAGGTVTATDFVGNGTIPIGGIIMWSGTDAGVPSNWALCDGSSGTPNLIDRFIVGRGSAYSADATGGSANATLVSHSHTTNSTSKTLTGAVTKISEGFNASGTATGVFTKTNDGNNNITESLSNSPVSGFTMDATHTHGTDTQGSAATNANLPPYYAIAYIMRIS